jgi:hypothetical protein
MANQGNRDREGNLGQPNRDSNNPTGTSGRRGQMDEDATRNHQEGGDRNRRQNQDAGDEDDESLGARRTNR